MAFNTQEIWGRPDCISGGTCILEDLEERIQTEWIHGYLQGKGRICAGYAGNLWGHKGFIEEGE